MKNIPSTRRSFLTAALAARSVRAGERRPRIVLRSSWAVVNIGDIAHTPGVLALLEKYIPEAEVRLWPSSLANGVDEMLRRRFPKVAMVDGPGGVRTAFEECDFFLHGSGASLVAAKDVERWRKETGKPYGIYGITFQSGDAHSLALLSGAKFVFFRDSASLEFARSKGAASPVMEFGPDGAFAVDLRNDQAAEAFLAAHKLEKGRFLCCIPRYRVTPRWKMLSKKGPFDAAVDEKDQRMKEHDHVELRNAIGAVVRQTKLKVLVCAEDETQIALGKEMLYDPLPEDVRARVVWRDHFWLTDEALSTYVRSAGLFGNEMHSPIMAIGNGVPAIVCRWTEQTTKGLMWRDIGLGDWLFDVDNEQERKGIVPAVLAMAKDPAKARRKAAQAQKLVHTRQRETMQILREALGAAEQTSPLGTI